MDRRKRRGEPEVLYALPTEPGRAGWSAALHTQVFAALQKVTQENEFVYADDWEHASYLVYPHQLTKWPNIPVWLIPDGDTYSIAAKDGRFRIIAQFPDWTLTVQGGEFIRCFDGFWLGDCLWLDPGLELEAEGKHGLAQLLKHKLPQRPACVQAHVLKLLAEQGHREVLEVVQPLLLNRDVNVRFDAALACLYLGDERCVEVLRTILARHVVPQGYGYWDVHQLRYERVIDGLTYPGRAPALQTEVLIYLEQTPLVIDVELALTALIVPPRLTQFPKPLRDPEAPADPRPAALRKLAIDLGQTKDRAGLDRIVDLLIAPGSIDPLRHSAWWIDAWPDIAQALVNANHRAGLQRALTLAATLTSMPERAIMYSELANAFIQSGDKAQADVCFPFAHQAIDDSIADGLTWYPDLGLKALAQAYFMLGDSAQALAAAHRITDEEIRAETFGRIAPERQK
jgi:hypothetical protein